MSNVISEQKLFDRLVELFSQQLTIGEDIKALKGDAKYHKEHQPNGISADDIKFVTAAAKLEAQQQYEEFSAKAAAVSAKFKELSNYDN